MAKITVGVDISKKTFDVSVPVGGTNPGHAKYPNRPEGFVAFSSTLPAGSHVVMEASGSYYLPLATHLHASGYAVSVVTPLSMSHFTKMRMHRSKTDKKDAGYIREYGESEHARLRPWQPRAAHLLELQNLCAPTENLTVQRARLKNMVEAFTAGGVAGLPLDSAKDEIAHLSGRIAELEGHMLALVGDNHGEMFAQLTSIPGMGAKSAMMLIVVTGAFTRFTSSKQLAAFVGLDPRVFESGTSVRAKPRIKKMGMARMRQLLYLCAMCAKSCNGDCARMYARLVSNGKNGKQAVVAVAHKLLRQAFAVATSKEYYREIPV